MFICVAMVSLFGRGGGCVEESGRMEKERIHNMTTKIFHFQRHFLYARWPDLGRRSAGQRGKWRNGARGAVSTQTWQKIVRWRQLHLPSAPRQFLQLIASVWAVFELLILPCKICMIPWISIILREKRFQKKTGSRKCLHAKEWEILF